MLAACPQAIVLGEDVGAKGGVYGVTLGLQKTFGAARVFDTPLDEQTILGLALGASLAGLLPIAEIQYLAYLHNAEDQLRGEAATLGFFSDGQYANGLVVRIAVAGLAQGFRRALPQRQRDRRCCATSPASWSPAPRAPAEAPELLRTWPGSRSARARVGVLLEPTALYHDKGEAAPYAAPERWRPGHHGRDMGRLHWAGRDVLVVTFGNGVGAGAAGRRARRASPPRSSTCAGWRRCRSCTCWRWPPPSRGCWSSTRPGAPAASPRGSSRRSSRVATPARSSRVTAEDSFVPLGPAAAHVVLTRGPTTGGGSPIVARLKSYPTPSPDLPRSARRGGRRRVRRATWPPSPGTTSGSRPSTGCPVSSLAWASPGDVAGAVARAAAAYDAWRLVPAPVRGAVVRRFGELLREHLDDLATLVTVEVGKITSEARGEVQEMVDICDYAVGLSRQLFGRTMTSERPGHRLMETWHPLGRGRRDLGLQLPGRGVVVEHRHRAGLRRHRRLEAVGAGAAVRAGVRRLLSRALDEAGFPADVSQVVLGDAPVGLALVDDPAVALLSATGSTRMGREVGPRVAARFGRSLLELGGNNAAIVGPSADLDLTTRGIVFSAAGTAGQRCTSMRRVIAHSSVVDAVVDRVAAAYEKLPIGSPSSPGTLVGPLVNGARTRVVRRGRRTPPSTPVARWSSGGTRVLADDADGRLLRAADGRPDAGTVGGRAHRDVRAAAVRDDVRRPRRGRSPSTTPCRKGSRRRSSPRTRPRPSCSCRPPAPTAASSTSTSAPPGAEIGGAFGGEKETGGGRESGSDAWRAYMRRATNTINYSGDLPLAQGVTFDV